MIRRVLVAPLLAALVLAVDAAAQDEDAEVPQTTSIRWLAYRAAVEIPRADGDPYVLRVEVPEQAIAGGRVRVLLRGPDPGAAPVIAYGRFAMTGDPVLANRDPSSASGSEVAMESLQLVAEGLRVDPPAQQAGREGAIMVDGLNPEILSPRDAAPLANAQIVVPLPDPILKDLGG
jgi:hypothetical protein